MDCSLPGSSVHGIFQARILEWVAISFSRRSSRPRGWTRVSGIVGRCFTIWATREVNIIKAFTKNLGLASYLMIKPESFPLKIKTRQGCLLLPLLFNTKMQVPARIIRQLKKKKKQVCRLERKKKNYFYQQNASSCIKKILRNPYQKNLLELKTEFSKFSGYEINIQKLILFLCTNNEQAKIKLRKKPI